MPGLPPRSWLPLLWPPAPAFTFGPAARPVNVPATPAIIPESEKVITMQSRVSATAAADSWPRGHGAFRLWQLGIARVGSSGYPRTAAYWQHGCDTKLACRHPRSQLGSSHSRQQQADGSSVGHGARIPSSASQRVASNSSTPAIETVASLRLPPTIAPLLRPRPGEAVVLSPLLTHPLPHRPALLRRCAPSPPTRLQLHPHVIARACRRTSSSSRGC